MNTLICALQNTLLRVNTHKTYGQEKIKAHKLLYIITNSKASFEMCHHIHYVSKLRIM